MKLFEKWFCKHKWKTHIKQDRVTKAWCDRTNDWVKDYEYTREILICEHCGKIKKLEY